MKSIIFDEGYTSYSINGDESRTIKIKLGDANLVSRGEKAVEKIEELSKKYGTNPTDNQLIEFDKEIRAVMNEAFDTDVCTPAFGNANVCTINKNGNFAFTEFFTNLFEAIKGDVAEMIAREKTSQPEIRPEVTKYLGTPDVEPVMPDISKLTPEQKKALIAQLI